MFQNWIKFLHLKALVRRWNSLSPSPGRFYNQSSFFHLSYVNELYVWNIITIFVDKKAVPHKKIPVFFVFKLKLEKCKLLSTAKYTFRKRHPQILA